jgi:hypothetical protein
LPPDKAPFGAAYADRLLYQLLKHCPEIKLRPADDAEDFRSRRLLLTCLVQLLGEPRDLSF